MKKSSLKEKEERRQRAEHAMELSQIQAKRLAERNEPQTPVSHSADYVN
jgi:hypothetical protein